MSGGRRLFFFAGPVVRRSMRPSSVRVVFRFQFSTSSKLRSQESDPVRDALQKGAGAASSLLAPVHVPRDPEGVLNPYHPSASILEHSSVVVHRQLEMMNVMLGFEEANKYVILDPTGFHIGYMAERELGMGNAISRQMLRTHRQFTTHVFDRSGSEVLRFHRPFSFINSTIRVYDPVDPNHDVPNQTQSQSTDVTSEPSNLRPSLLPPDQMPLVGQVQQIWAPLRRKYDLFIARQRHDKYNQEDTFVEDFAYIDSPFLAWDFTLRSTTSPVTIGSVDRNFMGFGREIFTDTGVYALRMDSASLQEQEQARSMGSGQSGQNVELLSPEGAAMTLDQRAVMLAMAVTVDYDYFSRDRGGFMFMPFPMGGGGGAVGGAAAGEAADGAAGAGVGAAAGTAAEAGIVEGAGSAAAGGLARGAAGEIAADGAMGGAVGAGSIAGYEAMQRARQEQKQAEEIADPAQEAPLGQADVGREDVWGFNEDPFEKEQEGGWASGKNSDDDDWFGGGGNSGGGSGGGSSGGGGGGGGDGGSWLDGLLE